MAKIVHGTAEQAEKPCPDTKQEFSAACKAHHYLVTFAPGIMLRPSTRPGAVSGAKWFILLVLR
jgi:hypothetical protein